MNTRVILTIVLISFGSIAAILPKKKNSSVQLDSRELMEEIRLETYKISPDVLAAFIIAKDPSVQLIDVRSKEEFEKYHLPGALNIPLANLFDEDNLPYVDQLSRRNIFYSNGTTLSSQAWILCKQSGINSIFILDGGLNKWFETIIQPREPASSEAQDQWDLYLTRKAASAYFTGSSGTASGDSGKTSIAPVPRKAKARVKGGCS